MLFDFINDEFSPGYRLVNLFSSYIFFHQANHKNNKSKATHLYTLNEVVLNSLLYLESALIVANASIKKMLLYPLHIYIHIWVKSKKSFIIQLVSLLLKSNCLLLGVALNKLFKFLESSILSLLPIQFIWQSRPLIQLFTHVNNSQLLSLKNLGCSSTNTISILLNFGIVQVLVNGLFMS